jgi:benzoylformate decarboxylase
MVRMMGKHAMVEMLRLEGVEYVFGNPGTTELPLIDALQDAPDIKYVLTLFEGVAAGMADGWARIKQKPAFMNFHISVGVSNSIAVMYNSWRGGTPMVITAGQSHSSLQLHEPTLYSNMVNVMREYTKWSGEIVSPQDIPSILRRAFKIASTPPTGPVFLSVAWDAFTGEAEMDLRPSINDYYGIRPDLGAIGKASSVLGHAERPIIIIGDRVAQSSGAPYYVSKIAEQLGAAVFATSYSEVHISNSHPHYMGTFDVSWLHSATQRRLNEADVILAIGTDILTSSIPIPEPALGDKVQVVHVDSSEWAIQRSFPAVVGLWSDIRSGLDDLTSALDAEMSGSQKLAARQRCKLVVKEQIRRRERIDNRLLKRWNNSPMSPERFAYELRNALPPGVLICDDSITNRSTLLDTLEFDVPGTLVGGRGGSLGFGMGATLGMKLAAPDRPVIGIIGDGTAMYTIQSLWTAANYNIPVVYVFCNNGSYKVLKENMARYLTGTERKSTYLGMDFYDTPIDFVKQANAYGLEGIRVEDPTRLGPALDQALATGRPYVLDVIIDDQFNEIDIQEAWGEWWARK